MVQLVLSMFQFSAPKGWPADIRILKLSSTITAQYGPFLCRARPCRIPRRRSWTTVRPWALAVCRIFSGLMTQNETASFYSLVNEICRKTISPVSHIQTVGLSLSRTFRLALASPFLYGKKSRSSHVLCGRCINNKDERGTRSLIVSLIP